MRRITTLILLAALCSYFTKGETTPQSQQPKQQVGPGDVVRITTNLVQTDVVVTDKNEQIIKDLTLSDFELTDNGKKQELSFLEFVAVDADKRVEGTPPATPRSIETGVPSSGVSAAELKRVIAFVIDDLTIPIEDMSRLRELLLDFVDNRMMSGDLVTVVRVVGGSGLLEQFSDDKQLLRNSIARLTPKSHPFAGASADFGAVNSAIAPAIDVGDIRGNDTELALPPEDQPDDINLGLRSLMVFSTANSVIASLKSVPGRKSLVLVSGGLPLYQANDQGIIIETQSQQTLPIEEYRSIMTDASSLLHTLTDNASRAGVVINTMDVRGLKSAAVRFDVTPAKSALGGGSIGGGGMDPSFGRTADARLLPTGSDLAGIQGLRTLADATGGVSVVNTNNFRTGLDKILTRSQGYYLLGYSPSEKFDGKFHKLQVKVKREGARIYTRAGYIAKEEGNALAAKTKQEQIVASAVSPLAKRELGVSGIVQHKFLPDGKAALDIQLLIDANKLSFVQSTEGTYQTSFDVVGFVFDASGKNRGGFSETVNANLPPAEYKFAQAQGLSYSASTQLPPGYYQLRAVVRENGSGRLGSISRYIEVPDLSKKKLTMSSLFLFGVDPGQSNKPPDPLQAQRRLSRKQDLRYAAIIYNPKLEGGKPALISQLIVSQGNRVLFKEPEQPLTGPLTGFQVVKIGQLVLSKVAKGTYVLTLAITDTLDKKDRRIFRSIDFTVVD
jgi:VWFA-related protein